MGEGVKHVLVASLGLSPAVVTETLWAMLNPPGGRPPQPVDRVHVLTTARWHPTNGYAELDATRAELAKRIAELYSANKEKFPKLELEAPELIFEAVKRPDGGERKYIADVSTQEENILFAGRITRIVWEYAQDPGWVIHMSLAGGRKSMSSYAHTAMMFFGRVQDELTHVLVEPAELELCGKTFWYPGQEERAIRLSHRGPDTIVEAVEVPTDMARVELVQVPYLRLNVLIPLQVRIEDVDHDELVRFVDFERARHPVVFDYAKQTITFGHPLPGAQPLHPANLETRQFCLISLLAMERKQAWTVSGSSQAGRLALSDFSVVGRIRRADGTVEPEVKPAVEILKRLYRTKRPLDPFRADRPDFIQRIEANDGATNTKNPVQPDLSKVKDQLAKKISSPLFRQLVIPGSVNVGGVAYWGLDLPPERIELANYPQDILAMGAQLAQA